MRRGVGRRRGRTARRWRGVARGRRPVAGRRRRIAHRRCRVASRWWPARIARIGAWRWHGLGVARRRPVAQGRRAVAVPAVARERGVGRVHGGPGGAGSPAPAHGAATVGAAFGLGTGDLPLLLAPVDGLVYHGHVVHVGAGQLHDHLTIGPLWKNLEVVREDPDPVDELPLLPQVSLDLLDARLLAQLLDCGPATAPLQRIDELNAQRLDPVPGALGVLNPIGQQELSLVDHLRSLLRIWQSRLGARLELDGHAAGDTNGWNDLKHILVLLEDVKEAPVLEVRVLLQLCDLKVGPQLRERDRLAGMHVHGPVQRPHEFHFLLLLLSLLPLQLRAPHDVREAPTIPVASVSAAVGPATDDALALALGRPRGLGRPLEHGRGQARQLGGHGRVFGSCDPRFQLRRLSHGIHLRQRIGHWRHARRNAVVRVQGLSALCEPDQLMPSVSRLEEEDVRSLR
mmetsp:Transcript_8640/g.27465  ORF Transcript_8640/g.27465 Transcript_8640/m.27465 type:complete len:457 (+) Transcript_8640:355-1725(+)